MAKLEIQFRVARHGTRSGNLVSHLRVSRRELPVGISRGDLGIPDAIRQLLRVCCGIHVWNVVAHDGASIEGSGELGMSWKTTKGRSFTLCEGGRVKYTADSA